MKKNCGLYFKSVMKMTAGLICLLFAVSANAQLSEWGANIATEFGKGLLIAQFVCGVLGFFIFVGGLFEYNRQKKGQKEYGVAYTMFFIGILLGIAAPLYLQSIKSVTDEDTEIQSEFDGF